MARTLVTIYKGWHIFWDDSRETTVSEPKWIAKKGNIVVLLSKTMSLNDVLKELDEFKDSLIKRRK